MNRKYDTNYFFIIKFIKSAKINQLFYLFCLFLYIYKLYLHFLITVIKFKNIALYKIV